LEAWAEAIAQAATIKKGPASEADQVGGRRALIDFSAIKKERWITVEIKSNAGSIQASRKRGQAQSNLKTVSVRHVRPVR
jgi:hypothetical protein